jgi:hypothetical protein
MEQTAVEEDIMVGKYIPTCGPVRTREWKEG